MADSTFNDWLIKYRRNEDLFINGSKSETVNLSPAVSPGFIELGKDTFKPLVVDTQATTLIKSSEFSTSTVKLSYKEASLEFSVNELEKVMEILRRW